MLLNGSVSAFGFIFLEISFVLIGQMESFVRLISMVPLFLLLGLPFALAGHDYGQALSKSILFFEAQRSGYLPHTQRVTWRANSGLQDGKASGVSSFPTSKTQSLHFLITIQWAFNTKFETLLLKTCNKLLYSTNMYQNVQVDLVGGYYDAGDNVKFGLPMAFTITMMSWSILEYGKQMASSGELSHAVDAVKWGSDYLIKAHPEPYVLYGEVPFTFEDLSFFFTVSLTHKTQLPNFIKHYLFYSNSSLLTPHFFAQLVSITLNRYSG